MKPSHPIVIKKGRKSKKNPIPQVHIVILGDNSEPLSSSEPLKAHESAMVNIRAQYEVFKEIIESGRPLEEFIQDLSKK